METNQNSIFTKGNSCWNLGKTETAKQHILQDQNPMASVIWPNFSDLHLHQTPSNSSSSSSSGLLSDMLGIHLEQEEDEEPGEELGAMKEMMYKVAAMQPVEIDPAAIRKPKRRNVRISNDPQSVAARHRRERISEKIRILQRLVPGGTKMDTASMLDEAIRYVKFLKRQIRLLQSSPFRHPQCIGGSNTAVDQVNNSDIASGSLNLQVSNWPFEPNILLNSATSSAMGTPAGLGFNFGDHTGNLSGN